MSAHVPYGLQAQVVQLVEQLDAARTQSQQLEQQLTASQTQVGMTGATGGRLWGKGQREKNGQTPLVMQV